MKANINEDELKLLAYLHEHAEGFGESFQINTKAAAETLGFDDQSFRKHWSYLEEHGLVGTSRIRERSTGVVVIATRYLTGLGEDYMRELENQPGIAKKITVKVVTEGWATIQSVAASVLGEVVKTHLGLGK
jgi:hypothetical protein